MCIYLMILTVLAADGLHKAHGSALVLRQQRV